MNGYAENRVAEVVFSLIREDTGDEVIARKALVQVPPGSSANAYMTLTVSNPTDRVAYFIHLTLRTPKGKLIEGVRFSDNYISLEPHGKRVVTCCFAGQQPFKAVITK